ncbi:hypothetical protein K9N68_37690 (plasmid) [Kovacikia minuta CCNUW1]|uniref:hypothetical protein n=1 Tax=Kovacikia minuta TaxID=2931930 RepID=UPI001CCE8FF0|nr:hypothetical protein [Kovacikia minuta]UBF29944.1 hypothetical protein K9N68_37690 [Kovacikia minuta CCNUW1]
MKVMESIASRDQLADTQTSLAFCTEVKDQYRSLWLGLAIQVTRDWLLGSFVNAVAKSVLFEECPAFQELNPVKKQELFHLLLENEVFSSVCENICYFEP